MSVHPVTPSEVPAAAETIAQAFRGDPVWRVALAAEPASDGDLLAFWRCYVEGALPYETAYAGEGARTVSVWIPPGADEMTEEQEHEAMALVERMLPADRSTAMTQLWDRFAEARPDQPHGYLSLLATHPDHAGHGYGMAHLAADLQRWDEAGSPTYLESTNPLNNRRYEAQGYRAIGGFEAVLDGAVVTTMWRPVGG